MTHEDYTGAFEGACRDIEKLIREYGEERALQKMWGCVDAINIAIHRIYRKNNFSKALTVLHGDAA